METFIVLQVFWDMFLILIAATVASITISYLASIFFTEEQITNFLNKYGV